MKNFSKKIFKGKNNRFKDKRNKNSVNIEKSKVFLYLYKLKLAVKRYHVEKKRRYSYVLTRVIVPVRKKRFKKKFLVYKLLKIFFFFIKKNRFRYYRNKILNKNGYYPRNYLYLIESRLGSLLYRTH